jgi:hypothetical protein
MDASFGKKSIKPIGKEIQGMVWSNAPEKRLVAIAQRFIALIRFLKRFLHCHCL